MHGHCHTGGWHGAGRRGFRGGWEGFGPFGGRMGGGPGGPFKMGRMLGDGDLKLIVLALLAEQPRHGYDVIKALEEHSHGAYSPSPGIVYPTLTFLEEAGYADATSEGNKKVYAITEAGRKHLADNQESVDTILSGMKRIGEKIARARAWFYRHEDGGANDIPGVIAEVNDARRALKAAIAEKLDAPEAEQRRVAEILREAAAGIRGNGPESSREGSGTA